MSPKIIGQKKAYLAAKLRNFRDMKRINPYMNGVVAGLTDQEIDNLSAYYSNYRQR
jgi:cytochrome c553